MRPCSTCRTSCSQHAGRHTAPCVRSGHAAQPAGNSRQADCHPTMHPSAHAARPAGNSMQADTPITAFQQHKQHVLQATAGRQTPHACVSSAKAALPAGKQHAGKQADATSCMPRAHAALPAGNSRQADTPPMCPISTCSTSCRQQQTRRPTTTMQPISTRSTSCRQQQAG